MDNRPIGIFDSGVGGLTVANAINKKPTWVTELRAKNLFILTWRNAEKVPIKIDNKEQKIISSCQNEMKS